jgi:hypothetical protein
MSESFHEIGERGTRLRSQRLAGVPEVVKGEFR